MSKLQWSHHRLPYYHHSYWCVSTSPHVYLASGAPSTPSSAPSSAPTAAPTASANTANVVTDAAATTQKAVDRLLHSQAINRRFSPLAMQNELLLRVPGAERPKVIADLQEMAKEGGSTETGDIVESLAIAYKSLASKEGDDATLRSWLQRLGQLLGYSINQQTGLPHVHLLELLRERLVMKELYSMDFAQGSLKKVDVSVEDLSVGLFGSKEVRQAAREIRKKLQEDRVEELLKNTEYRPFLENHVEDLKKDFVRTAKKLREEAGPRPAGYIEALTKMPSINYEELITRFAAIEGGLKVANTIKGKVEQRILQSLAGDEYKDLMNRALAAPFMESPQEFALRMGALLGATEAVEPGAVFRAYTQTEEGVRSVLLTYESGAPDLPHGRVTLSSGGVSETLTAEEFAGFCREARPKLLTTGGMSKEAFFQKMQANDEIAKSSTFYLQDKDVYHKVVTEGNRVKLGAQLLSWAEIYGFALEHNTTLVVEIPEDAQLDSAQTPHKKDFFSRWMSTFASPSNFVLAATNIFTYLKENLEDTSKEQGYSLLYNMLPDGIFKMEIEAKWAALQDEQMNTQLNALKGLPAAVVAKGALEVFTQARNVSFGKGVKAPRLSIQKAYLLALLEKGGELYYGPLLAKKGAFFIYEALGGRIGDTFYKKALEEEQENAEDGVHVKEPPEWRCIMKYMDKYKTTFGPVFYDTFDGAYNRAKDAQMDKQAKQLADVQGTKGVVNLNINEVYTGRFWRVVQGVSTTIEKEKGAEPCFQIFFHQLAMGERLDAKQRKNFVATGATQHMPLFAMLGSEEATKDCMDTVSTVIRSIAKGSSLSTTKITGKGESSTVSVDLSTFDMRTFMHPGFHGSSDGLKAKRDVLSQIYSLVGHELFHVLSGNRTYKILGLAKGNRAVSNYVQNAKKWVSNYQPANNYDADSFKYFGLYFNSPADRGGNVGLANMVLDPSSVSQNFTFKNGEKARVYLDHVLSTMEHMRQITTGTKDEVTGLVYSKDDVAAITQEFQTLKEELYSNFVSRMNENTKDTFMKDASGYGQRMSALGVRGLKTVTSNSAALPSVGGNAAPPTAAAA